MNVYQARGLAAEITVPDPTVEQLKDIYDKIREDPSRQRKRIYSEGGSEISATSFPALLVIPLLIVLFFGLARIIEYSLLPASDYIYVVSDGFLAFFILCFAGPFTVLLLETFIGRPLFISRLGENWEEFYSATNPKNLIVSILLVFLALATIAGLYATAVSINSYTALTESGIYDSQKLVPWDQVKDVYRVSNNYGSGTDTWYEIDFVDGTQIVISRSLKEVKYSADRGAAYVSQKIGKQIQCGVYDQKTGGRKECGPEVEMILIS